MTDTRPVNMKMCAGTRDLLDWIAEYCNRGNRTETFFENIPPRFFHLPVSSLHLLTNYLATEAHKVGAVDRAFAMAMMAVTYGAYANAVERHTGQIATIGETLTLTQSLPLMQHGAPEGATLM